MSKSFTGRRASNRAVNGTSGLTAVGMAALIAAATLVGCGGGGSSGPAATPAPAASAAAAPTVKALSVRGCTVADGAGSCEASVTSEIVNAVDPRTVVGDTVLPGANLVGAPVTLALGSVSVAAKDGATVLKSVEVTTDCSAGLVVDKTTGKCGQYVAHYAPKAYVLNVGVPRHLDVGAKTLTAPVNATVYSSVSSCFPGTDNKVNGFVLFRCTGKSATATEYFVASLDPSKGADGTLSVYAGVVPAGNKWVAVPTGGVNFPDWSTAAAWQGGYLFVQNGKFSTVRYQDASGAVSDVLSLVPFDPVTGKGEMTIDWVMVFSN